MRQRSRVAWIAVVALVAGGLGRTPVAGAELRIGIVDMQRALNESDAGKKAKDQVKAKFEKAQDALKRQKDDLEHSREDFEKKAIVLKDEERRNLEKDLEGRTLDFKRKYEDFQRDLQRTDRELTSGIVAGLYEVVQDYGREKGYTMILEAQSGQVVFSSKDIDITDEIVSRYNAAPRTGHKGGKDRD